MFLSDRPALILAPMDGITDAPMREFMGRQGAFSFAVSEFVRVSHEVLPKKVFTRHVPEIAEDNRTASGLPVQVQILGGDPDRMAASALNAIAAGANAIDLNFGCPAPTVNRNDGGATLLRTPCRVREVVRAVRDAVPSTIPVSAKMRLGWESVDEVYVNARMAAEGGASWITIHARTKVQGYQPPVYWRPIGEVRRDLDVPVVANGDIWSLDDFRRCQDQTGCAHYMIGRSALADPALPGQIARELGLLVRPRPTGDWTARLAGLVEVAGPNARTLARLKQWLNLAHRFGDFPHFEAVKRLDSVEELLRCVAIS